MSAGAGNEPLRRVTASTKKQLLSFAEGVYLVTITGRTIDDLQHQATADRLGLARSFLGTGDKLMRTRPPQFRSAISRYYYAMYHGLRAVVFFVYGGDDQEKHAVLPGHIPSDFPDNDVWGNALKDARVYRNAADYDPYDIDGTSWRLIARGLSVEASQLLRVSEKYLRQRGCTYL